MPATVINVSAVEESTARALRLVAEQEEALSAIDRIVNNMEDAWDSDSQRAYTESFRRSKERIERFNESVNQSLEDMKSFVTECVDIDELKRKE